MRSSIRAIWILNNQGIVVFSRRFALVERRWRSTCEPQGRVTNGGGNSISSSLPTDSELMSAFATRNSREGPYLGAGLRAAQVVQGSDSWIDEPITRHIISLFIRKENGVDVLLWPLIFLLKNPYNILVLPLVDPCHIKSYEVLLKTPTCGTSLGSDVCLGSILVDLPCVTMAFMVAHALGNIITSDMEPDAVNPSSVAGLLDSLTGSIGMSSGSSRGKTISAAVASSTASGVTLMASSNSGALKGSRAVSKDALRSFISSSMPFGTPLDLNYSNISSILANGFSSSDLAPADLKQPAWKPYLYKGRQKIFFSVQETVYAAMYDRDELPDMVSISGQINCRAELEGVPDVSFPLSGLNTAHIEALSFHPCAQVSESNGDKQTLVFSPPLGNFVLMHYQAFCGIGPPVRGFYQLSVVSADEGAFILKLSLMEGYNPPLTMEFCTVTLPFHGRRVLQFDGNPSIGVVSMTENSLEWRLLPGSRGITGKMVEATFLGTINFSPRPRIEPSHGPPKTLGSIVEDDSDLEAELSVGKVDDGEVFLQELNRDISSAELDEPFCWEAYNYARVSFKILGGSISGLSIDPKSVSVYPAIKYATELSMQALCGDYILWNTLGRPPSVAVPKV